jgi:Lamin Tail Domain
MKGSRPVRTRLAQKFTHSFALVAAAMVFSLAACDGADPTESRRVLTAVNVSVESASIEVGQTIAAAAVAVDQNGAPMPADAPRWTSVQGTVAGVDASGRVRAIAPGTTRIVAAIGGVAGERVITVQQPPALRIADVQTGGAGSSGSIELFNPTDAAVDLSGWTLIDDTFFGHVFTFPRQASIAARGSLVIPESSLPFGIDAIDDIRLFSRFGVEIDRVLWIVPRS